MLHKLKLGTAMFALCVGMTISAHAEDMTVFTNWSSAGDVKALGVLKSAMEAKGHVWNDIVIPHDTGSNISLMDLVTGGTPPNIFLAADPGFYRDLKGIGLARPLTQFFKDNSVLEHYPQAVIDAITIDGEIYKIPANVHIDGMIFYNIAVAKELGIDPETWTSFEQMFADFEKAKSKGIIPIALGAQQWAIGYLTHGITAAVAGQAFYNRIYGEVPDPAAIDTPEMREILGWVRKFAEIADEGSVNRDWPVGANLVIDGKALSQWQGDWQKGQWHLAGKEAGTDFGCIAPPGAMALAVTVDSFGILGGQSPEKDAAELDFASILTDPVTGAEFAVTKGATPTRLDAPQDSLDKCSQLVLDVLSKPEMQVPNPGAVADADWRSALWDVQFGFYSDPSMTVDAAIEKIKENYDTIFN